MHKNTDRCSKCGDSAYQEGFHCPAKKFQCKSCHKFGHYTSLCYQKSQHKQVYFKARKPRAHQLQPCTLYAQDSALYGQSDDSSSEESFCLQLKIQHKQASIKNIPSSAHLITNLAGRLKPHHIRKCYLRARLEMCADVNIMPAGVYRLMFEDPALRKLDPSELEIGTYTTNTVKIVGSCRFYLVHLDSKNYWMLHSLWPSMMQACYYLADHPCTWSHPAQIKIRLPATWSQLDHQLCGPSQENQVS